jgi:site-specific DNA-methyltransferase (adenine-specific)
MDFEQKSHYNNHLKRKNPCQDKTSVLETKIDNIIIEKLNNKQNNINNGKMNCHNTIIDNSESNSIIDNKNEAVIDIKNEEGLKYLVDVENNSVNLVLIDPPYIISKDTGMNKHYNNVKDNEANGIQSVKSKKEWNQYIKKKMVDDWDSHKVTDEWISYTNTNELTDKVEKKKFNEFKKTHKLNNKECEENYIKYGSVYGKKYCVKTDYGDWDNEFTIEQLDVFVGEYYKKLKKGGTLIMFFDLWKISLLKEIMEKHKFKQIRMIEWIKTNPQPLNSSLNYLTNSREIALTCVKVGKPTFNSKYDTGIYYYPIQGGGKNKFHPTQKSLALFERLIEKHSNKGDVVMDTFLGSGTTAIACKNTNRNFIGCEVNKEYYDMMNEIAEAKVKAEVVAKAKAEAKEAKAKAKQAKAEAKEANAKAKAKAEAEAKAKGVTDAAQVQL